MPKGNFIIVGIDKEGPQPMIYVLRQSINRNELVDLIKTTPDDYEPDMAWARGEYKVDGERTYDAKARN